MGLLTPMTKMLAALPVVSTCSTACGTGRLVLVIDCQLQNYDQLLDGVVSGAEVILLDPQQDGIHQITTALAEGGAVASLHLVAHGTPGTLQLGSTLLSAATLARYAPDLQQWANALGSTGELLIYGCEVAQGDRGLALIAQLSELTGVAIAASTTKTGNSALGGNWNLEAATGAISAVPIFSEQVQASYSGLLAIDPAAVTIGAFSGADVGEGLDLEGKFVYAVNVGGSAVGRIQAADFTTDTAAGVTVTAQNTLPYWFTVDYGSTQNDNKVEALVSSIRWSRSPGVVQVDLANLTINQTYKAQLLFSEPAGYAERFLDIVAEGQTLVDNFNPSAVGGYAVNLQGAVVTFEFRATDSVLNLLLRPAGAEVGGDQNPYISALTLEVIGIPELTNPIADQTAVEDSPFSFELPAATFTDPDGDPLIYTATLANGDPLPTWLSFNAETRTFSGTPGNDDGQPRQIKVTASDGKDAIADLFDLSITPLNDAPVLALTAIELAPLQEDAAAPTGAVGTLVSALVNLTPPVGGIDNVSDVDNTVTGIAIVAADTANGTWWFSIDNGANWKDVGAVSPTSSLLLAANANSRLYFQPNPNYNGLNNAVTFRAWDQTAGAAGTTVDTSTNGGSTAFSSAFGRAFVNVNSVNDAPTLTGTAATLIGGSEDTVYTVSASDLLQGFSDVDGDSLSVIVGGIVVDSAGAYTFTPSANFNGTWTLNYSVVDGKGASVPATQTVAIAPINDAPTGTAPATLAQGNEDTDYLIRTSALLAQFSDVDGDTLTISNLTADGVLINPSDSPSDNPNANPSASGTYTYTPAANFNGTVNLSYTVLDGNGGSIVANQSLDLAAANDAPTVSLTTPTTPAGIGIPISISAVVSDLDLVGSTANLPLQVTLSATRGNFTLAASALSNLTTVSGANGTSSLSVRGSLTNLNAALSSFTYIGNSIGTTSINLVVNDLGNVGGAALNASATRVFTLVNAREGTSQAETLTGTDLIDYLYGAGGNDTLKGLAENDLLDGGTGNDSLDGGSGADLMQGGAGNDTYIVDNIGDVVVETANSGSDTVASSITYTAPDQVENLVLQGSNAVNGIGNALDNSLQGNGGANLLDGGLGVDSLSGGGANDTYIVDSAGDTVVETANAGSDRVQSSVDYTLPPNVENLGLTGAAVSGVGNSLNNSIMGNSLDNILNGGSGTDTLQGATGADLYIVDRTNDTIKENANEGIDTVQSSVSYTVSSHVENLELTGTAALNGTGNVLANRLSGNDGANKLDGKDGNDGLLGGNGDDTLIGGLGQDTLTGGASNDTFRYALRSESPVGDNRDTIMDFADGDRLDLRALYGSPLTFVGGDAAFTALGQVRYTPSTSLLQANLVDGLQPDFEILLANQPTLNGSPLLV